MDNIARRVAEAAEREQHRTAVRARGRELSYREFRDRAFALATLLRGAGIQRGDRVAILSHRTDSLYVSVIGVLFAGATYVALNPRYPSARNQMIVKESGARALVVDNRSGAAALKWTGDLPALETFVFLEAESAVRADGKRVFTRGDLNLSRDAFHPDLDAAPDDLAYIVFTSGSTGKPKGVQITHANVLAYLENIQGFVGPTWPDDRVVQIVDITFDVSVHDMFTAWTTGAALISIPEHAALISTRFVQEHGITQWFSVPSTARLVEQSELLVPGSLPSIRSSIFAGEPLVAAIADAWMRAAPNGSVFNIYGPTEGTISLCGRRYFPGDFAPHEVVSLGEPFPGNRMGIFNPDTNSPVADGETGEICFTGNQVTKGYWNDPDLNARRFFTDKIGTRWYKTGDLGQYGAERGFVFAGRVDHQIKIRGFRVELGEIEGVIRAAAKVSEAAVIPWPLSNDGSAMGCVAFVRSGTEEDEKSIRSACARTLPDYMVPSDVIFLEELPLNANNKIDYNALKNCRLLKDIPAYHRRSAEY